MKFKKIEKYFIFVNYYIKMNNNTSDIFPTINFLNKDAKPFIPEYIEKENEIFNELEKNFVKNNSWIFEFDQDDLLKILDNYDK
jgi:hypothetical protein